MENAMGSKHISLQAAQWAAFLTVLCVSGRIPAAETTAPTTPFYSKVDGWPALGTFSPGRWGIVGLTVVNPGPQQVELLSTENFSGDPGLQFARQIWMP